MFLTAANRLENQTLLAFYEFLVLSPQAQQGLVLGVFAPSQTLKSLPELKNGQHLC